MNPGKADKKMGKFSIFSLKFAKYFQRVCFFKVLNYNVCMCNMHQLPSLLRMPYQGEQTLQNEVRHCRS